MNSANYWDLNDKRNMYVNLDNLLKYMKDNKKREIIVTSNEELRTKEINKYCHTFFDKDHGCFILNPELRLISDIVLNKDFYETNKEIIVKTLQDIAFISEIPYISKEIYDENFIKTLVLTADTIEFAHDVKPSESIIEFLSENHIAAFTKEGRNKRELTRCDYLGQSFKNLTSDSKYLQIEDTITDYENLRFIAPHKNIKIARNTFRAVEDYDNVYNIISTIRNNNQENYIAIELDIEDKENFKKSKLYNSNLKFNISGVEIMLDYELEEYKKQEELLDLIASDIKNSDLSPFEKYIAAYNISKKFKEYNENKDDLAQSRYFKYFMNNDYMVCVGYAKMLADLCDRIGINSYDFSLKVDTSYDKGFSKEEKVVDLEGHARTIIYINDPKYGLDGYYIADPTWDNFLEYDLYNYALMSFDKTALNKRYVNLTTEDLIMNVKDIEEYISKINFLLNRTEGIASLSSMRIKILKIIKVLFPEKYKELENKYSDIENTYDENIIQSIIMEAGYIFVEKNGKDIPLETIIDAAGVVNARVFGFDEMQAKEYRDKLYDINLERDKDAFPYYYENKKSM